MVSEGEAAVLLFVGMNVEEFPALPVLSFAEEAVLVDLLVIFV